MFADQNKLLSINERQSVFHFQSYRKGFQILLKTYLVLSNNFTENTSSELVSTVEGKNIGAPIFGTENAGKQRTT